MPYHVYTRIDPGAFIVETARQALEKVAQFAEQGHPELIFKGLLGNILNRTAVIAFDRRRDPPN